MTDASRIADIRAGDHACLTFTDPEERLDLVAAFVAAGLRAGQRVVCVTDNLSPPALTGELTERGLGVEAAARAGQLDVVSSTDTFLAQGSFRSAAMLERVASQTVEATRDGFAGLWITSDMCWAARPVSGLDELFSYESQMNQLLTDSGGVAVCQYDRQCFDTVTLASVAASHQRAVAAATYHDDALLRICRQYQPPGVRVSGEIDYRRVEPLTRALSEALALDDVVHLNLSSLLFLDAAAAGTILQAAATLRDGQRMAVRASRQAGKLLQVLGLDDLPAVSLAVVADDR
ncbi:MAG TPA: MEDS domain-containing protein [Rugosimonospora sp.]|nr:MEDS domain-containing protein [Rugosimonospora sp.]